MSTDIPQMSLVRETRNATVETIWKQLEGSHSNTNDIRSLNIKQLYSLVSFT